MKHVGMLVLGSFINSLGTGLSAFGLAVVILRAYGTASSVAAVQMSAFAPIVLLAPLAGVLADRYDRRLMMMICDAGWASSWRPCPRPGPPWAGSAQEPSSPPAWRP